MKRVAELQRGLNLADLKRHDEAIKQLKSLIDAAARRHARLSGARRRLCFEGGLPHRRPTSTTGRSARLTKPTAADWNIFYQRGIAYERLKEWPKAEPNFRKALELFPEPAAGA